MLTVTDKAKQKLQQILRSKTDDPTACIRISLLPGGKNLTMSIDREKGGDVHIKDGKGNNVLLIDSVLSSNLEGQVIDFQEGHGGGGFTVSPIAPGDIASKQVQS